MVNLSTVTKSPDYQKSMDPSFKQFSSVYATTTHKGLNFWPVGDLFTVRMAFGSIIGLAF